MIAYLLVLVAVLTRLMPHAGWMNFTAVGGALLYFGAKRPLREIAFPVAALAATDFYLTGFSYHYAFHVEAYITTWAWYAAAIVLGWLLLSGRVNWLRGGAAALLGPTSFFVISNFAVWAGSAMYPRTLSGLGTCMAAGIPFYRNDVISTSLVLLAAFAVPALVRRMRPAAGTAALQRG